jgi:hypothetical protein
MAKSKQDNKLYRRLRGSGVRKKVARRLTALPSHAKGGRPAPRPLRDAVTRLEASVSELRDHVGRADRKAAGRKAAKTRRAKAQRRSASARKASRSRSKT